MIVHEIWCDIIYDTVEPELCDPHVLRPPVVHDHISWHGRFVAKKYL